MRNSYIPKSNTEKLPIVGVNKVVDSARLRVQIEENVGNISRIRSLHAQHILKMDALRFVFISNSRTFFTFSETFLTTKKKN